MTNIKILLYQSRKRIKDSELLKIQTIINEEIERRTLNDNNNSFKHH